MIFENVDFSSLPENDEEAFVSFENEISKSYVRYFNDDREDNNNHDMNGNYYGSYSPEREYLNAIMTFIDEYNLDLDIPDINALLGQEFINKFQEIKSIIGCYVLRISLRKNRINSGTIGTLLVIESSYKAEVGSLLETIRKIVNQEIPDIKKRDNIFKKIASLQLAVDRDQMTADAIFTRMIDLTDTLGQCAENIEPLVGKLERIKKIFWDKSERVKLLPKKERQKLISQNDNSSPTPIDELEDEIPF